MDWQQLLSHERLGSNSPTGARETRTDFQRDFDRIVFSAAFRRLQDKTQVFPLAQSDYVRTRLTHSLEVSSVGRTLGTMVGESILRHTPLPGVYPQDLGAIVAAACLAHDIGNPPFGHAGEDAIRVWFVESAAGRRVLDEMSPAEQADLLNFEGNAQGFRTMVRLQSPDNPGGMQLTAATLGAFSKYPRACRIPGGGHGPTFTKFGFFQDDRAWFERVADSLGLQRLGPLRWQRHPLAYLVEAADDICYRIVDIEDAFRLRLLDFTEVKELLTTLAGGEAIHTRLASIRRPPEQVELLRAKAIGQMVEEMHAAFMRHQAGILAGTFQGELIERIPSAALLERLRARAEEAVYVARPVVEVGAAGFQVLAGLLEAFVTATDDIARHGERASARHRMLYRLLPERFTGPGGQTDPDAYRRVLGVTDFIAGMTDSYAVSLYKKITGISLPSG